MDPDERIKVDQLMEHPWFNDRTMRQTVDKIFEKFKVCWDENEPPINDNIDRELVSGVAKRARISSS